MKAVVDTNFLINLLFVDQPYHKKAKEIWKKLDKAYIPIVVLLELSYFLSKKNKLDFVFLLLSDYRVEIIENNKNDILFAIGKKPLKYDELNDYIILHTALRLKLSILTFDEDFKKNFPDVYLNI